MAEKPDSSDFVHLHVHTHYSLLDGACRPGDLADMAIEYGMGAVAMTDHGYVGGAQDFYETFKKKGVKPIIGCEAYISPTTRTDRTGNHPNLRGYHLLLLAENLAGYHSLCKLVSEAYRNGMYYKPRIDKELLREYHDGLIAMSACIKGEVPCQVLDGDFAGAEKSLREYLDIFGKDNFFLEVMNHGLEEERRANKSLIELSKRYDLKLVATNDVHYSRKEHVAAHEVMLCIQTQAKLEDPNHFRFSTPEFYFKSPQEMKELFKEIPEAITNTRLVADRCGFDFEFVPEVNHYPVFHLSDGTVPGKDYLRRLCLSNIQDRYGFDPEKTDSLSGEQKEILTRMDYELDVIERTGFVSYFLVVSDFIQYAKNNDIPVGPGRGSGAGSIVAFLTRITDIDPIRYKLIFERFLNPERVSPPDFDIDFCEQRRGEVIEYVRDKYGHDSVAQICTYGQLKPKAVIKDVIRVMGKAFADGDRVSKLIPEEPKITLKKALEMSRELRELKEREPWVAQAFSYAEVLEGLNRQLGIHAAGVIIGDQPLDNLVPLARGAKQEIITQFPAAACEHLGLLKMDFLGLKTLTIIHNAVTMIEEQHGVKLDMAKIPLDDQKTFDLLRSGNTVAVFQLESQGMQNLCRQFGVDTIEHIIALVAIYRPGPMQLIPMFIKRKRGEEKIEYPHPALEPILRETYGIMLYQEQTMQVAQALAGFTMGGADVLRKAIGKKKLDVMAQQKPKFIAGCVEKSGLSRKVAEEIWSQIEVFGGYGFNKSHSAAYGIVSYQTAYLKANYPVEFMASVLSSEMADATQIAFFINECHNMGIEVLPPDVNSSAIRFGVDSGSIRFGLGAIKGVGEGASEKIIESRRRDGKFKSFLDFCERCGSAVNSRMVDHLARAGAFDSLGLRRSQILAIAEPMMSYAAERARDKAAGQDSLFDLLGADESSSSVDVPIPDIPEFDEDEILKNEKELLGFYVTGHPLAQYAQIINAMSAPAIHAFNECADNTPVRFCGMVDTYATKFGKASKKPFGVLTMEDLDSTIECTLYERALNNLTKAGIQLEPELPIVVYATIRKRGEGEAPRVMVDRIELLKTDMVQNIATIFVDLNEENRDPDRLKRLRELCAGHPGGTQFTLSCKTAPGQCVFIDTSLQVGCTFEFYTAVKALMGEKSVRLKATRFENVPRPARSYQKTEEAEPVFN